MWIEIFKTGTHTDSAGNTRTWTEKDLDEIVSKYNPREHESPVVIGHPKDNAPAYGWVEKLEKRGKSIWAKIKPTVQEFVDWVKQGLYKKVSISLYPDLLLRHIGFLGAMPPAVKGLKLPEFADSEYIEIEFREWTSEEREKLEKKEIKGDFAGPNRTFPIAGPDDVRDAWRLAGHADDPDEVRKNIIRIARKYGWLDALPESAIEWAKEHNINLNENLNEGGTMETKVKELETKLEEKEAMLAEFMQNQKSKDEEINLLKAELEKIKAEKRKQEHESFCEGLVKEGKLTPAQKAIAIDFMEILCGVAEYEFSEGGKKSPLETFKEFLQTLPKQVEFGEVARNDRAAVKSISRKEFEAMKPDKRYEFIKSGGTIL